MIYADTDFFMALMKESDRLKKRAVHVLREHEGQIWTSTAALMELLLLAARYRLDPEILLVAVLEIADLQKGDSGAYLLAAHYMNEKGIGAFDALHAAFCGPLCKIISSDRVFDRLGFTRIPIEVR